MHGIKRQRVGDVRMSQAVFSFGVGSLIDLPHISVIVMGLDDWDSSRTLPIAERRLLAAVQSRKGLEKVARLAYPPAAQEHEGSHFDALDESNLIGIPVACFPRWMLCPTCRLIAPLSSQQFDLKQDIVKLDRVAWVHTHCEKAAKPPPVVPARFLVACEQGHIDDFPWNEFVHRGKTHETTKLRFFEMGATGGASDLQLKCEVCEATRSMAEAFERSEAMTEVLGRCGGRRPHLRDREDCSKPVRPVLLGSSNSWFPITLSVLSVPQARDELAREIDEQWNLLERAKSIEVLQLLLETRDLLHLSRFGAVAIFEALEDRRAAAREDTESRAVDIKVPEWERFTDPDPAFRSDDFEIAEVEPPKRLASVIQRVVQVKRLREVVALLGFTRLEAPGEFADEEEFDPSRCVSLSRNDPKWLPACEVFGEGIFIQFKEDAVQGWTTSAPEISTRNVEFLESHRLWRARRKLDPPEAGYPGLRYVLLHSFSHALMRQVSLECGYSAASIKERIYALSPQGADGAMAGVLIYTAAQGSEGTLGGLVSLAATTTLKRLIGQALEGARLCASDPLCAEHTPSDDGRTLHGAACHACLFAPETSCERGNRYLDRSVLVDTMHHTGAAFFA